MGLVRREYPSRLLGKPSCFQASMLKRRRRRLPQLPPLAHLHKAGHLAFAGTLQVVFRIGLLSFFIDIFTPQVGQPSFNVTLGNNDQNLIVGFTKRNTLSITFVFERLNSLGDGIRRIGIDRHDQACGGSILPAMISFHFLGEMLSYPLFARPTSSRFGEFGSKFVLPIAPFLEKIPNKTFRLLVLTKNGHPDGITHAPTLEQYSQME